MIRALMKHPGGDTAWTRGTGYITLRGDAGWVIVDDPKNIYPPDLDRYHERHRATPEPPKAPKKRGRPKGSKNTKAKK